MQIGYDDFDEKFCVAAVALAVDGARGQSSLPHHNRHREESYTVFDVLCAAADAGSYIDMGMHPDPRTRRYRHSPLA